MGQKVSREGGLHGTIPKPSTNNTAKPKAASFFPLQKLTGTQPAVKTPAMHLAHLEKESAKKYEEVESKDPDGINGVMEEFIVHLVRAVKDTQMEGCIAIIVAV